MMTNIELDLILPCYNPTNDHWHTDLIQNYRRFEAALGNGNRVFLVLVNDGSTTGIALNQIDVLRNQIIDFQYITYKKNKGKGFAVRAGIEASKHSFQVYTDVDFPFELQDMVNLVHQLRLTADLVLGKRLPVYEKQLPQKRKILSLGSHFFNRYLLNLPFTDTQGGLKGFNAKGKTVFLETQINRFLFDTEFILRATKAPNLKIVEIPISARSGIVLSEMGFKVIKNELLNLFILLKIRFFG